MFTIWMTLKCSGEPTVYVSQDHLPPTIWLETKLHTMLPCIWWCSIFCLQRRWLHLSQGHRLHPLHLICLYMNSSPNIRYIKARHILWGLISIRFSLQHTANQVIYLVNPLLERNCHTYNHTPSTHCAKPPKWCEYFFYITCFQIWFSYFYIFRDGWYAFWLLVWTYSSWIKYIRIHFN